MYKCDNVCVKMCLPVSMCECINVYVCKCVCVFMCMNENSAKGFKCSTFVIVFIRLRFFQSFIFFVV